MFNKKENSASRHDIVNFQPTTLANKDHKEIERPYREKAEDTVRNLIRWLGESPQREGFRKQSREW